MTKQKEQDRLSKVLELAELGFRIHPLLAGGKKPVVVAWPLEATTDSEIISRWYRVDPERNWGIATGRGLLVIDIDVKNGDGEQSWEDFTSDRKIPKTVEATTPTGGRHIFFKYPEDKMIGNSVGTLAKNIDVRADGGYVAAVPTITKVGKYAWVEGKSPKETLVAPAPKWLIEAILKATPEVKWTPIGGDLENGNRNNTIFHNALQLAKVGTPFDFALDVIQKWLQEKGQSDMSSHEISATVESAYKRAEKTATQKFHRTDMGNIQRFEAKFGEDVRYVYPWKKWIVWNGKRWEVDSRGYIRELIRQSNLAIYEEIALGADQDERAKIAEWAFKSEASGKVIAVEEHIWSLPSLSIDPMELDSKWDRLNLANGTFDVSTGKLEPHNKEDFITKMIFVNYNPEATCPNFLEWLFDSLSVDDEGNPLPESDVQDMVDWLQMSSGRLLFGGNPEKEAFFLYGPSNTGKTTYTSIIERIAGEYAKRFNIELLLDQKIKRNANDATPELAALAGARIAIGTEMPPQRSLNEALFKDLTGGNDRITARGLHQDPFEFIPQFKILLYGNDRPRIRPEDLAAFNRLRMVPMKRIVSKEQINPNLFADRFEPEVEGILKWLLDGAVRARHEFKDKIPTTRVVDREKEFYMRENDYMQQFVDEANIMIYKKGEKTETGRVYNVFTSWMRRENGNSYPPSRRLFTTRIAKILQTRIVSGSDNKKFLQDWVMNAETTRDLETDF